LNFKLLKPFKLNGDIDTSELIPFYGLKPATHEFHSLIDKDRYNLILHPKSKGSAREWSLDSYLSLVNALPADAYKIFITGLKEEGDIIRNERPELLNHPNVTDLTGKLNLEELTSFLSQADGLVACSTGVLHLASALGIFALGLFAPMKPIHPGRWMPVGKQANYLVLKEECNKCRISKDCICIKSITVEEVKAQINRNSQKKISRKQMLGVA
jgi:ADP-heptose:LPS heptosyltransferase